jgi:2-succinyl-6-hydroxy-2,4-cyclohexadiene-1-carboxylate synthase
MEIMNHFYHGLFGSPASWSGIVSDSSKNKIHNLYQEDQEELLNLKTKPDDVLVGYSLGGRIALEIARRNNFNLRHLLLLSSHPGLLPNELDQRKVWEDELLEKMKTLSVSSFIEYWNGLPLFSSSQIDQSLSKEKLDQSALIFDNYRLSKMPSVLERFTHFKDKITWVVGDKDTKYKLLIKDRVIPHGISTVSLDTDHRVLEAKSYIKKILELKGIL